VEEDIEGNPFIREFYADPKRTAFQTQMFFLLSRYQQQLQLAQGDLFAHSTVSDYMFQKDRIFAYLTLNDAELALYDRIYQLLDPRVTRPDLVVYLQARRRSSWSGSGAAAGPGSDPSPWNTWSG
jgi:deoxyguanosine kinase